MNPDNLRNWLRSVSAELRAKRLLVLLAAVLVIVAIAIPLVVSHSGTAASLAPLPAAPTVTTPANTPSATTGAGRRQEPRQNYLTGPSHNPFVQPTTGTTSSAKTPTAAASSTSTTSTHSSASGASRTTETSSGSSGVSGSSTVTVTTPSTTRTVSKTTTVPARQPYSNYEVVASVLQNGVTTTPTVFHNLSRYQLLPSDGSAFTTFLGVRTDRLSAVFVLIAGTTVTGQGTCAPSASDCTFLTLIPGQSARLVVTPSGGAPETFTLSAVRVTRVESNASTVTIDTTGAHDVKQAETYIPALRTARYAQYTGLLSIDLGSTVPVTP